MKMNLKFKTKLAGVVVLIISLLICSLLPTLAQAARLRTAQRSNDAVVENTTNRLEVLRKKGDHLISVRIKALNKGISRLKSAVRISDEDRDSLISDLQTNIDGLNDLKTKIDAETDLVAMKSEVRSIFVDFRIFMVVLPRDKGLFAVARLNHAVGKLENVSAKLETAINELKQAGKDTSEADGYLTALKNDLANAKSDINQAESTFSSMTPEKDDEAKSMVKSGIAFVRAARQNIKDAIQQARKISTWLRNND